jgi:hypothetical protein
MVLKRTAERLIEQLNRSGNRSRPPLSGLAAPILLLALGAALLGCGGGSDSTRGPTGGGNGGAPPGASAMACGGPERAAAVRVVGIGCAGGLRVEAGWTRSAACAAPAAASRASCLVRGFRCLAIRTDRGLSVSCSRPGRSISFRAPPR